MEVEQHTSTTTNKQNNTENIIILLFIIIITTITFYSMSKNNILVYCQGCRISFNGNKNQHNKSKFNTTSFIAIGDVMSRIYIKHQD